MSSSEVDPALRFLQLVAEGHRWQLLKELAVSDRRVGELTVLLDKPQNLVSYHLAELREGGLVSARRSSADGRDTYYRLDLVRLRAHIADAGAALHPSAAIGREGDRQSQARTKEPRVLFLCSGNSARSQMAEAILESRSGGAVRAWSAGSHPKAIHPNAVRVMAERGIDIADRTSKPVSRFARSRFDRVVTLCDKVREICPEFAGSPRLSHWSMPDPSRTDSTAAASYSAFEETADEIEARIDPFLAELVAN